MDTEDYKQSGNVAFGMICYGPAVVQASALAYSLRQYPPYFPYFPYLYIYSTYCLFLSWLFFNQTFKAGSTQATRLTAARQIGDIAKSHPQDLTSLLKKVLIFLMFCLPSFYCNVIIFMHRLNCIRIMLTTVVWKQNW